VIDYLRDRRKTGIPVFFYFSNEETMNDGFLSNLMSSLIKQLVILTDYMPKSLESAYELRKRPELHSLINIFMEYSRNLSFKIYVLLDAFDECQPKHHWRVVSLIQNLNENGIRVYITMRDYLSMSNLFMNFHVKPLQISAHESDMKKFVEFELKDRINSMPNDLPTAIINKVVDGIDGM
jgi:hypothetical protein